MREPSESADVNSDLSNWYHSERDWRKIPDQGLKSLHKFDAISFVFHQKTKETNDVILLD